MSKKKREDPISRALSEAKAKEAMEKLRAEIAEAVDKEIRKRLNAPLKPIKDGHNRTRKQRLVQLRVQSYNIVSGKVSVEVEAVLARPLNASEERDAFKALRASLWTQIKAALKGVDKRIRVGGYLHIYHRGPGKRLGNYESGVG